MSKSTARDHSPPPSAGKLDKYVLAYATLEGVAVGRVRHWISFMMLSGALDRAAARPGGPRFIVKGGVALELRLPRHARATDDLDVVVECDDNDLVGALDTALREPYGDCTFTRKPDVHPLGEAGLRVWVQIAYRSQRWATVQVDLGQPEGARTEAERLAGIPLARFGLSGPREVVCLSLRYHVAQKFHGVTRTPPEGGENVRYRDAVDLLLLRDLIAGHDMAAVRDACEETFRVRAEHAWPPALELPRSWRVPFATLARGVDLAVTDLDEAELALRAFLAQVVAAREPNGTTAHIGGRE